MSHCRGCDQKWPTLPLTPFAEILDKYKIPHLYCEYSTRDLRNVHVTRVENLRTIKDNGVQEALEALAIIGDEQSAVDAFASYVQQNVLTELSK